MACLFQSGGQPWGNLDVRDWVKEVQSDVVCAGCEADAARGLTPCSKCGCAFYCSERCRMQHESSHSSDCRKITEALQESQARDLKVHGAVAALSVRHNNDTMGLWHKQGRPEIAKALGQMTTQMQSKDVSQAEKCACDLLNLISGPSSGAIVEHKADQIVLYEEEDKPVWAPDALRDTTVLGLAVLVWCDITRMSQGGSFGAAATMRCMFNIDLLIQYREKECDCKLRDNLNRSSREAAAPSAKLMTQTLAKFLKCLRNLPPEAWSFPDKLCTDSDGFKPAPSDGNKIPQIYAESLPKEVFLKKFLEKQYPLLHRKAIEYWRNGGGWTEWKKWSDLKWWLEGYGHRTLPCSWMGKGEGTCATVLSALAHSLGPSCARSKGVSKVAIGQVSNTESSFAFDKCDAFRRLPSLDQDMKCPFFIESVKGHSGPRNLFIKPANSKSKLECVQQSMTFFTMIAGFKYIRIYPPDEKSNLENSLPPFHPHAGPAHVSLHRPEEAFDGVPQAANARYFEAVLEPGDVLFIPLQWWLYTRDLTPSIAVTFEWEQKDTQPTSGFRLTEKLTELQKKTLDDLMGGTYEECEEWEEPRDMVNRYSTPGQLVTLKELSAKPELNGKQGKLKAWIPSKERWAVEVDGVGAMSLKVDNLSAMLDAEHKPVFASCSSGYPAS